MGFKCGIVGLPNVGKSTLFNALTQAGIEAANYPFCTIEPNVGVVMMQDARLDALAGVVNPERVVPTTMEFVDIAGLVKGASKGEGLGNKFLAHIGETQAIVHVVRCFDDDDVIHVDNNIDPCGDAETINMELILADLETVEKNLLRNAKLTKSGDKEAVAKQALLTGIQAHLDGGQLMAEYELSNEQRKQLHDLHLLTIKPMMYVANVAEDGFDDNLYLDQLRNMAEAQGAVVVPICAAIESELAELPDDEKQEFLADMGLSEPGLSRLIHAGYQLLGLQTYFTAGVKEVRAWTISVGATAPKAASVIHGDFEKGFIRAEVIAYEDFIACDGESGAKEAGKWRLEGKEYIVQDADVIHFRFNV